jgi:hypothetical protein
MLVGSISNRNRGSKGGGLWSQNRFKLNVSKYADRGQQYQGSTMEKYCVDG